MSKRQNDKNWTDLRKAVYVRDQHQCRNCLGTVDTSVTLDPDHNVPRGVGGSDRLSNIGTLCRRCHDAKHGNGIAPTLQIVSSGEMTDTEFIWFKHLLKEMLPAMSKSFDVMMKPKFGIADQDMWHLPLGDIRRLDEQLSDASVIEEYSSLRLEEYM